MTVFIAEDNRLISLALARMVQRLDHRVVGQVPTGEEAIRGVAAVRPDMLIMDIQLAGVINGIEAVAEIRNHQVIPVIYDSANPAMLAREQQRNPPRTKFLSKPVSCSQLERAIQQLAGTCRTGNPVGSS